MRDGNLRDGTVIKIDSGTICYFQKMIVEENRECTIFKKVTLLYFPGSKKGISAFISC